MSLSKTATRPPATVGAEESPADRLLATATELFAAHGIRAIGIDRILRESGVAKASLYKTYGSKDALVVAYLEGLDHADRNRWTDHVADIPEPENRILAFFDLAIAGGPIRNFRGCQYANAATEFPGVDLPPIAEHREWVLHTLIGLLDEMAVTDPHTLATRIQVIYDGSLSGSKMDRSVEPIRIGRAMVHEMLAEAQPTGDR